MTVYTCESLVGCFYTLSYIFLGYLYSQGGIEQKTKSSIIVDFASVLFKENIKKAGQRNKIRLCGTLHHTAQSLLFMYDNRLWSSLLHLKVYCLCTMYVCSS